MKCKLVILLLFFSFVAAAQYVQPMGYKDYSFYGQGNIGKQGAAATHPSAYLELGNRTGSNKGFLPPGMTTAQRNAISNPGVGLLIFNDDTKKYNYYNGNAWTEMGAAGALDFSNYYTTSQINAFFSGSTPILGYNKASWDSSFVHALFDPLTRKLTFSLSGGGTLDVTIPADSAAISGVLSFNERTGAVQPSDSDYTWSQIAQKPASKAAALGLYDVMTYEDTLSLSNRINQRVKYSDTAYMLKNYMRKSDTLSINSRINKLISDSLVFKNGLKRNGNEVDALYFTPMWNADRIQSFWVHPRQPLDSQVLMFKADLGYAEWSYGSGTGGGSGVSDGNNYTTGVTFSNGVLQTQRYALGNINTDLNNYWLKLSDTSSMLLNYQHWNAGYLKSYTETDPIALAKTVTATQGYGIVIGGSGSQALINNPTHTFRVDTLSIATKDWTKKALDSTKATFVDTDDQTLSISGRVVSISAGNSITLPSDVDTDAQTLSISGSTLSISGGNSVTLPAAPAEVDPFRVTTATVTGGETKTLTLTRADGSTVTTSFTDLSGTGGGGITEEVDPTVGSHIKAITTTNISNWNTAYNKRVTGLAFSGTSTKTGTITFADGTTVSGTFSDLDTDTDTDAQTLILSGQTLSISGGNSVTLPPDTDTDNQALSISGNTLSLQRGGSVTLPTYPTYTAGTGINISVGNVISSTVTDTDDQTLSITGQTLTISEGNSITLPSAPAEVDPLRITTAAFTGTTTKTLTLTRADATTVTASFADLNTDAQTLSISGQTLTISGGNSITLPGAPAEVDPFRTTTLAVSGTATKTITLTRADGSTVSGTFSDIDTDTNTDAQTLSITGSTLSISGGNSVSIPVGPTYSAGTGISINGSNVISSTVVDTDTDDQTLSITGSTLSIDGGNSVTLPTGTTYTAGTGININGSNVISSTIVDTDAQTLSITGSTVSIVRGNSITLPAEVDPLRSTALAVSGTGTKTITITRADATTFSGTFTDIDTDTDDQTLSITGQTLTISEGNSVTLPTLTETDPLRIITLAFSGTTTKTLTLTGANGRTVTGNFTDLDTDTDDQTLSLTGSTLAIEGGNSVTLPSYTDTDDQTLSISGNTLTISEGNSVVIPSATNIYNSNGTLTGNRTVTLGDYDLTFTGTPSLGGGGTMQMILNDEGITWERTNSAGANSNLYITAEEAQMTSSAGVNNSQIIATPTAITLEANELYFPGTTSTTTANVLYYNTTNGRVTYGAAPTGGGSTNEVTALSISGTTTKTLTLNQTNGNTRTVSWTDETGGGGGGGSYTFSSGLTESPAGSVKLGGALTQNTAITTGSYTWSIGGNHGYFNANATNTIFGRTTGNVAANDFSEFQIYNNLTALYASKEVSGDIIFTEWSFVPADKYSRWFVKSDNIGTEMGIKLEAGTSKFKLQGIPSAIRTNVLYFNTADSSISYGAAPTGGGGTYSIINLGAGAGIYASATAGGGNTQFELKSLLAGTNIAITNTQNDITIGLGTGIDATKISTGTVSNTEFNYLDGVTSSIQTQLNNAAQVTFTLVGATNQSSAAITPADATTYYFGVINPTAVPTTTAATRTGTFPTNCTLIGYAITTNTSAAASQEAGTLSIRINNTTDYLISNAVVFGSAANQQRHTQGFALNHTFNATDSWELKFVSPTWATNPQQAQISVHLIFRQNSGL